MNLYKILYIWRSATIFAKKAIIFRAISIKICPNKMNCELMLTYDTPNRK